MKKIIIVIFLILISASNVKAESVDVKLKRCIDGDTARFIIGNEEKSVRFLAINTPEIKHGKKKAEKYGVEASRYTCKKLKSAKKITIEYDNNSSKTDKYGRSLGWIFVDNELLQADLVKNGYAEIKYLYGNYKYTNKLKKAEKEAKKSKLNIWSDKEVEESDDELDNIVGDIFKYIMKKIKAMI